MTTTDGTVRFSIIVGQDVPIVVLRDSHRVDPLPPMFVSKATATTTQPGHSRAPRRASTRAK